MFKKKKWQGSTSKLGISNLTIERNLKDEKGFRGVFTSDGLPKKIRKFENGVINLDVSTGPGTHWVCYYNDPQYDFVEYFDPFGEYVYKDIRLNPTIIPKSIYKYLSTSGKDIVYNSSFLQNPISNRCGYYCMTYIVERNKGQSPIDVLYSFTQEPSDLNEDKVI